MTTESSDIAHQMREETPSTSVSTDPAKDDQETVSKQDKWLQYTKDVKAINTSTKALSVAEQVPAPTTPEIPSWLQTCFPECHFTWIQSLSKFGIEDARILNQELSNRFFNVGEGVVLKELEHLPFDVLSSKMANAFCHLFLREFERGAVLLSDVTDKISRAVDSKIITPDHGQGITYLVNGLETYQKFLEDKIETPDIEENYFALLPKQATVVVRGFKARIFSMCRKDCIDEQLGILQQICDEDPKYCMEWRLAISMTHKRVRLSDRRFGRAPPSGKERAALTECLQKDANKIVVKFAVAHFLGELLRCRKWNAAMGPLTLTKDVQFRNEDEVHEYISAVSQEVFKTFEGSRKFCLNLAELLTMTSPRSLQDLRIGKKCLQMALEINPEGSKDNHRMGLFLYFHERNFEEGLVFTRKAYDVRPTNFPALVDTLQLLMRDVDGNATEIKQLFKLEMTEKKEKWTDNQLGTLHVLYGIFCFMSGNHQEVIDALLTSYKFKQESLWDLKNIPIKTWRYNWAQEKIKLEEFQNFILSSFDAPLSPPGRKECLHLAVSAISHAIESRTVKKSKENASSSSSRGGIGNRRRR